MMVGRIREVDYCGISGVYKYMIYITDGDWSGGNETENWVVLGITKECDVGMGIEISLPNFRRSSTDVF